MKSVLAAIGLVTATTVTAEQIPDALFDRFLSVVPDRQKLDLSNIAPLESDVQTLLTLNPRKEKVIRKLLLDQVTCNAATTRATTIATMRSTLDQLGVDKATRITDFYAGAGDAKRDSERLDALNAQLSLPGTDGRAVETEMLSILNRYALVDFANLMQQEAMRIGSDWTHVEARKACWDANTRAMAKAKLKSK